MFDIGWTELLVIGVVALIVVGPKDLPVMFHTLGKFTARLRSMAREFTRAMDDAAKESGAKDIARDLRTMTSPTAAGKAAFSKATGLTDLDPFGEDPFGDDDAEGGSAGKSSARKEAAGDDEGAKASAPARGPHTEALAKERADAARKQREDMVARANARAEAGAEAYAPKPPPEPSPAPTPAPEPGMATPATTEQDKA